MLTLFLLAVAFCLYTYLLFPLLLHWRASRVPRYENSDSLFHNLPESELPMVSIVIAAHNEASRLPDKLASLRALDYPDDKIQICIVSDGSTDKSVELLEAQADVTWDHYEPAAGKSTALNTAVELATGEFIVFTDARQAISENAVRALLARFDSDEIGAVSGELMLSDDGVTEAANVGLYWRYEKWIRQNESRLFSTTGATGALYAVRRKDITHVPAELILDDFVTPIQTLKKGKRTVFEPAAKAFDRAESDSKREFVRKVRTLSGNYQAFNHHRWLFNPRANKVWWQFLSHKVARLIVPYALMVAFIAAAIGDGWFLDLMFWLQLLFYATGLLAGLSERVSNNRIANIIKVFLQMNAAAVVGAFRYFTGGARVTWRAAES